MCLKKIPSQLLWHAVGLQQISISGKLISLFANIENEWEMRCFFVIRLKDNANSITFSTKRLFRVMFRPMRTLFSRTIFIACNVSK